MTSNQQLTTLYGVESLNADLSLLLRHRAVLFGIVGALLVYAAFQPSYRDISAVAGLFSMVSFSVLALMIDTSNPALIRIAWIDVAASVALLIAVGMDRLIST